MKKALALCLLFISNPALAMTAFTTDLSAGITLDDNITNGKYDDDIEEDQILEFGISSTYTHSINSMSNLLLTGSLVLEQYQDFDKLSNNELAIQASYQFQINNLYTSPWYFVSIKLASKDSDSIYRDQSYNEIALGLGKRLTDKTRLLVVFENFSADADNDFHDVDYNRIYTNFDFIISDKNTVYTTLSYYDGDIISTAGADGTMYLPYLPGGYPHTGDDAYPTLTNPWTYNINATTLNLSIGNNFAIDSKQAIDASINFYDSDANYNMTYDRMRIELHYLYRF